MNNTEIKTTNNEIEWVFNHSNNLMSDGTTFYFSGNLKETMKRNIRGFLQSNGIQNHFGMGYFFAYGGFNCEYREMENGKSVFIKVKI